MSLLRSLSNYIDQFIDKIGQTVSWISLLLIIVMCIDVLRRYILKDSKVWMVELEWHLFSVLFLFGASYTLLHDKHVRVDLFYENMSDRHKAFVNIIGTILFVFPWCWMIMMTSWDYASNSFSFKENSPQPGGLPARYIIKFSIFLGSSLLFLQAISVLIKSYYQLKRS